MAETWSCPYAPIVARLRERSRAAAALAAQSSRAESEAERAARRVVSPSLPRPRSTAEDHRDGPLPAGLREYFESRFGHDFGRVRVHAESSAAGALGGRAYAEGANVFFGPGVFDSTTTAGLEVIAHELAHVVQQGAAPARQGATTELSRAPVGPALLAKADVGGTTSSTKPPYAIDDVKKALQRFNRGPVRGDLSVQALDELGWTVLFWKKPGNEGNTFEDRSLILLPPELPLERNVVVLFHESIHARYPLAESGTEEPANLEDELRAKYQEFLFLRAHIDEHPGLATGTMFEAQFEPGRRAHIDQHPGLAKGTMFEVHFEPGRVKQTKAMSHEQIVKMFANDILVMVVSENVLRGKYKNFAKALTDATGSWDFGKLVDHPALEQLVRRALKPTREYLLEDFEAAHRARMRERTVRSVEQLP